MQCLRTIDWIRSEGHTGVVRHLQADSWKIVSAADDKTLKVTLYIIGSGTHGLMPPKSSNMSMETAS